MILHSHDDGMAIIALNDPGRRNALSLPMFDAIDAALAQIARDGSVRAILLRGAGPAFCAGFDLAAAAMAPALMAVFVERLSRTLRLIRRLPQPVVAAVHGAAIAGGCALLSACDFVFVETGAKLGYPVHRIGISPAVTLPTLLPAIGPGPARALVLAGQLVDGAAAARIGLATHVVTGEAELHAAALDHTRALAAKPPRALQATKRWLNELDGSFENDRFDHAAAASASGAETPEAAEMLRAAWAARAGKP